MINLTGPAGLFPRIAGIGSLLETINLHAGVTIPAGVAALSATFGTNSPTTDGLFAAFARYPAPAPVQQYLGRLAGSTLAAAVAADGPVYDPSTAGLLGVLFAQMAAAGQSVAPNAVGVAITPVAAGGADPGWAAAGRDDLGAPCQLQFAEALRATVVADSYTGGAPAGQEVLRVVGQPAASGPLGADWPGGSGTSKVLAVVDPGATYPAGRGQLLANGGFETFTPAGGPASWNVRVGTAGTQVLQSAAAYAGASCLAFVGDGSTATALDQGFGADNPAPLLPATSYALGVRLAFDPGTASPPAGALEVALVDGSGNVVADAAGAPGALLVDATALPAGWSFAGAVLRTPPAPLPTGLALRLRLATPVAQGATLRVDSLGLAPALRLYPGGPAVACFAGAAPLRAGGAFAVAATNDRAGALLNGLERLFGLRALGLLPPTAATPTITAAGQAAI